MNTGTNGSGDTIPKVIAYGWFGGNPKPPLVERCIESWTKHCPGWQIVELNESVIAADAPRWVHDAYAAKKWAFVADYFRMLFMYENGGVTLDADVELLRPIDWFLSHQFFSGQEINGKVLITATMGSRPAHPLVGMALEYYRAMPFNGRPNTQFLTQLIRVLQPQPMPHGMLAFAGGGVLYPQETFCPYNHRQRVATPTAASYAIHHFNGSWLGERRKKHD